MFHVTVAPVILLYVTVIAKVWLATYKRTFWTVSASQNSTTLNPKSLLINHTLAQLRQSAVP
jgi:hypothetical protein